MNGLQNTSTDTMFAPFTTKTQEGDVNVSEFHNNNAKGVNAFAGILDSLGVEDVLPSAPSALPAHIDFSKIHAAMAVARENGFFPDASKLQSTTPDQTSAAVSFTFPLLDTTFDLQALQDTAQAIASIMPEDGALTLDAPLGDYLEGLEVSPTPETVSLEGGADSFATIAQFFGTLFNANAPIAKTAQSPLHLDIKSILATRDLLMVNIPGGETFSTLAPTAIDTTTQEFLDPSEMLSIQIEEPFSREPLLASESLLSKANTGTLINQFGNLSTQNLQTTSPVSEPSNTGTAQTSALVSELASNNGGTQTNLGGESKQNQPAPTPLPLNSETSIAAMISANATEPLQQIFTAETSNSILSSSTNAIKTVSALPPATVSQMAVQQVGNAILQRNVEKGSDIVIRLDPAELGRVNISFTFDKTNGVTANIVAETSSTAAILRERADVLATQLKQSGFDNINLNFDTRGDSQSNKGFGSQFSNQQQNAQQQQPRVFEVTSQFEQEALHTNTMRAQKMYSATDAIDIKL